jgi:hypothetical protein
MTALSSTRTVDFSPKKDPAIYPFRLKGTEDLTLEIPECLNNDARKNLNEIFEQFKTIYCGKRGEELRKKK